MSNLLSGIPIVGGLFDNSDQQALDQIRQNQALYQGINLPQLSQYTPDSYQYAGDYNPEMASSSQIQDDPAIKDRQLSVLNDLAGLSNTGLSDVDKAGYDSARRAGEGVISSANGAALQNAQARGIAGSGLEMALKASADQSGADRAQQLGLQQAADSARQRALYEQAYGSAVAGARSQDFNTAQANSNIINQFNMANTNAQNQAQQYNLGNRQNISNQNTNLQNQAQLQNNSIKQQNFQDQMSRASGQAGANTAMGQGYFAENAANTQNRNSNTGLLMSGITAGMGAGGTAPAAPSAAGSSYNVGANTDFGAPYRPSYMG